MTRSVKILLLLVLVFSLSIFALTACGEDDVNSDPPENENNDENKEQNQNEKVSFSVSVKDYSGAPVTVSVLVEILDSNGNVLGMMPANASGVASFKLNYGNYSFNLKSADAEFYYDESVCKLTPESKDVTVTVYSKSAGFEKISVPDKTLDRVDYNAARIGEGATHVAVDRAEMSYYLFTPTRSGIYEISFSSDTAATIGYYGSPHFVQGPTEYNTYEKSFELEIKDGSIGSGQGGTAQFVFGIKSESAKNAVIIVKRIADVAAEEQWNDIRADSSLVKYDNLLNTQLVDIDVTDPSVKVFYNENDGRYHFGSVDGPLVLVKISVDNKYLPSFVKICETDRLCRYFYDDEGKLLYRESYNYLIDDYNALTGSAGAYPLDKKLADAIKNVGEYKGWWNFDSSSTMHIFGDDMLKVVKENAWLFACCYEVPNYYGAEAAPIVIAPSASDAPVTYVLEIKSGEILTLRASKAGTVKITNAEGLLLDNGTQISADENGVIECTFDSIGNFTLTYNGDEQSSKTVYFTFVA